MRYYEYLSVAKVEMLYGQLGGPGPAVSHEVGLDVKVLRATRRSETTGEPGLYDKLTAVEDRIYASEPVGSVDEPAAWIYGRMPLSAVLLPPAGDGAADRAVLFAGASETGAFLVMGGAARHLTSQAGAPPIQGGGLSPSGRLGLQQALKAYAAEIGAAVPEHDQLGRPAFPVHPELVPGRLHSPAHEIASRGTPLGACEFLAKRLASGPATSSHPHWPTPTGTLATPLFIALTD
ncbi:DUF7019 family protein [Bailinhaonella thermotolerans]|uniref:Uncharacterized protein n=1 Tax=Bailinhaonella thermotolerans TaxID=1070861 RepID=A0A3A4B4A5_9ACTN|nr:SAVMC3_10250 family protein [Bailinhaonella thermotolerans]RJL32789.1 hypothetical protein D5H75_15110 [Bailinhaonella thermotolerans]